MTKSDKKTSKVAPEIELLAALVRRYPLDWYIVYCNPRCERRAFRGLMDKGIFAWLPEQDVERKQPKTKRKFTVRMPIFTRYVFVGLDPLQRQSFGDVRLCDGVEGFVKSEEVGEPIAIRAEKLWPLFTDLYASTKVKPGTSFKIGENLEITAGVFAGFDLKVTEVDEERSIVNGEVDIFGRATAATVSVDDVKIPA